MKRRGKDLSKLARILDALTTDTPLPHNARPHALTGEWSGEMDCHVEGDWVLIYELHPGSILLLATGDHSDVFKGF